MDYAVLPPEINSARMYAGMGSTPMLTAAAGWDRLAATLTSTAGSYRAVLAELTDGPWQGSSAAAMAAAGKPYSAWMNATAAQAAETANQARAAAAAYEAAFAATVPPPVITANRAALTTLVSTNVFGQNSVAIAANQADYQQMWAQDAAAMYTYAANSAAAAPSSSAFTAPPQTTNPAGAAAANPGPLTQLAQQIAANPTLKALGPFIGSVTAWEDFPVGADGFSFWELMFLTPTIAGAETAAKAFAATLSAGGAGAALSSSVSTGVAPAQALLGASAPTSAGSYGSGLSAGLGRAMPVGGLSVPPTWATSPETIRLAAKVLPAAGAASLPEAGMAAPGGMLGGVPPVASVVSTGGSGRPGSGGRSDTGAHAEKIRPTSKGGDVSARPVRSGQPGTGEHTSSERDELGKLRELLADLAKERDALERSADSLLGLAGLRPVSGRR
ncbi:PPE family protein [Mycobacterium sp. M1]|uniref:PPE family protein n=1 Tax=Mycolicibacter acidiphilus TaxID=2835306 RepID=A0ABS5RLG5_9MYCO|nr:PPE family protein [Mycolicibacter acidiphilus]MBS9534837.1 PPE family protein [Mycolicibacter acidiphilus]